MRTCSCIWLLNVTGIRWLFCFQVGIFPFSSCLDFSWILPFMSIAVPHFTCVLKKYAWVIVIYGNLDWLPLNYYLWFWSFMVILSEFYQVFVIIYFPTWYSFVALLTQYSDPTQSLSSDLSTRDPAHHPLQRVLHGHIFHIQLSNSVFLSVLNGLISLFKVFS